MYKKIMFLNSIVCLGLLIAIANKMLTTLGSVPMNAI